MDQDKKPRRHSLALELPFDRLSPRDFERLTLWLVQREGYERAEHLGAGGGELGRDIVAWKHNQRVVFQCKRVRKFGAKAATDELDKLGTLSAAERPERVVFVVTTDVTAATRAAARRCWARVDDDVAVPASALKAIQFWALTELDERVNRHPDILRAFFDLPDGRAETADAPFFVPFGRPALLHRERELERLRILLDPSRAREDVVALVGPGGVGKTQLAILYAYQCKYDYPGGVFWIDGKRAAEPIIGQLAAHALSCGLASPKAAGDTHDYYRQLALVWLGTFGRRRDVLLLIDNVQDETILVRDLQGLPSWRLQGLGGSILVTSRRHALPGCTDVTVGVLEPQYAAHLLLRESGRQANEDSGSALTIAQELGGLPLAVRIAGGFLRENPGTTFKKLAAALDAEGVLSILGEAHVPVADYQPSLDAGLTAVIQQGWQALQGQNPQLREALLAAACLPAGQMVSIGLLRGLLGRVDEGELTTTLEALARSSLLERPNPREVRLHPLVHAFCGKQISTSLRRKVGRAASRSILSPDSLAEQTSETLLRLLRELPMVESLVREVEPKKNYLHTFRRILDRAAHRLGPESEPLQQLHRHAALLGDARMVELLTKAISKRGRPWLRQLWSTSKIDPAEVRVFRGHTKGATSCALSADGSRLLSGSLDQTVRLWDAATADCVRSMKGHSGSVMTCAISHDAGIGLSGSFDQTLRLWNLDTGYCERVLQLEHPVVSCSVSADGATALATTVGGEVVLWETASGEMNIVMQLEREGPHRLVCALSGDGQRAFVGAPDGQLEVTDLASGTRYPLYPEARARLGALALSADGRFALSGWWNGLLHLWEIDSGAERRLQEPLLRPRCRIDSCALSATGDLALAGSLDGTLRAWNTRSKDCVAVCRGHTRSVRSCALPATGAFAVSAANDRTLRMVDLELATCQDQPPPHRYRVQTCELSAHGTRSLSGSHDLTARLWATRSGTALASLDAGLDRLKGGRLDVCALSRDGRLVLTSARGLGNGTSTATLRAEPALAGEYMFLRDSCFEPDHDLTRLWDVAAGDCRAVLKGHEDWVTCGALSADGKVALTGAGDGTLRLWDTARGDCRSILHGHSDDVLACDLTADGSRALSGSRDNTLRLWDAQTADSLKTLAGHEAPVMACAISDDGHLALSGDDDGILMIWDLDKGVRHSLGRHTTGLAACGLSEDGSLALSVGIDEELVIWDSATASRYASVFIDGLSAGALNSDGLYLFVGQEHGHVSFFRIESGGMGSPPDRFDRFFRSIRQWLFRSQPSRLR